MKKNKIKLANLPTKIEKLNRFSDLVGKNIYIKRDDQTGLASSGNKIRKLEYVIKDAMDKGATTLITAGGIQSNHARATAALAAKLGMRCILVLRSNGKDELDGNYFLGELFGAEFCLVESEELSLVMERKRKELLSHGEVAYVIPAGASSGLGCLGYRDAFFEILEQEKEEGIEFDTIVCAIGSGGTYAGLLMGNETLNNNRRVTSFSISVSKEVLEDKIERLFDEIKEEIGNIKIDKDKIDVIDSYIGRGYARSIAEEIEFIKEFARMEGIILDPTYTCKCMYGLKEEIEKGTFENSKNILFIHTGGLFGIASKKTLF